MTENEKKLDRYDVVELVNTAHAEGEFPNLSGLDLQRLNLAGLNLENANLRKANLYGASLEGANLRGAYLGEANLQCAHLKNANLRRANLWRTNLQDADWDGLEIIELPSGQLTLIPTCHGWELRVGCWEGTPNQLRTLIAQDEDWPEAEGEEVTRRRPYLEAALALCEVHMKDHIYVIRYLKEKWGNA